MQHCTPLACQHHVLSIVLLHGTSLVGHLDQVAALQMFVRKLSWAKTRPMSPAQRVMLKTRGNSMLYSVLQSALFDDVHPKKSVTESLLIV